MKDAPSFIVYLVVFTTFHFTTMFVLKHIFPPHVVDHPLTHVVIPAAGLLLALWVSDRFRSIFKKKDAGREQEKS